MIKRKCEYCGKYFETNNKYKRFCNRKCKDLSKDKRIRKGIYYNDIIYHKTCPVCSKEFNTNIENKVYCSDECRNIYKKHKKLTDNFGLSNRNVGKIKSNIELFIKDMKKKEKEQGKIVICPICNKKFIKQNKYQKYCSRECYGISSRKYKDDVIKHLIKVFRLNLTYNLNYIGKKYVHRVDFYKLDYESILGCTFEEYKIYLESLFQKNMNWDNFSNKKLKLYWEIDHIIPRSSFEFFKDGELDVNELHKCFNYKNTQPLWDYENRLKSNK